MASRKNTPKYGKAARYAYKQRQMKKNHNGCYIATAVYGSYDCPQVWTLRRFRDFKLANTWHGRMFIRIYYSISPVLVKYFGSTKGFRLLFKPWLDKKVASLQASGISNTPYIDRQW